MSDSAHELYYPQNENNFFAQYANPFRGLIKASPYRGTFWQTFKERYTDTMHVIGGERNFFGEKPSFLAPAEPWKLVKKLGILDYPLGLLGLGIACVSWAIWEVSMNIALSEKIHTGFKVLLSPLLLAAYVVAASLFAASLAIKTVNTVISFIATALLTPFVVLPVSIGSHLSRIPFQSFLISGNKIPHYDASYVTSDSFATPKPPPKQESTGPLVDGSAFGDYVSRRPL